ncbi:MAG: hypothetical protein ABJ387_01560 [Balneola sp.]
MVLLLKYIRHKFSELMISIGFKLDALASHIHSDTAKPCGFIDQTRWALEDIIANSFWKPVFWKYSSTDLEVAHDVYEHGIEHCSSRQITFIHSELTVDEFIKNELRTNHKYMEENHV